MKLVSSSSILEKIENKLKKILAVWIERLHSKNILFSKVSHTKAFLELWSWEQNWRNPIWCTISTDKRRFIVVKTVNLTTTEDFIDLFDVLGEHNEELLTYNKYFRRLPSSYSKLQEKNFQNKLAFSPHLFVFFILNRISSQLGFEHVRITDDVEVSTTFLLQKLLFRAILFIVWEVKSSFRMERFFTRCLPIFFTMFFHVSEREFFSPKCSKFAVECDWNSKISRNVQNLENLLYNPYQTVWFLENVFSGPLMRFFNVGRIRKYDDVFSRKKRFHLFKRLL